MMTHYRSVQDFQRRHNVLLDNTDWRLCPPFPIGQIVALPLSHGRLVATNGILCYIVLDDLFCTTEAQCGLYLGHIAWFVPDSVEDRQYVEHYQSHSAQPLQVVHQRATVQQLCSRYNI